MNEPLTNGKGGNGATARPVVPRLRSALWLDFYLGHVSLGARLPSVRTVARRMGISPTTALEFYQTLAAEGLVEARPRSGIFLRHVGMEAQRRPEDVALLKLLDDVARRLPLLCASPARFADLLMLRTGQVQRSDFAFGFVGYRESFDLLYEQIRTRVGFNIPVVRLPAHPADLAACATHLRESGTIRCLLSTYLYAKSAFDLGRRFGRPVIVIQLQPSASEFLSPPAAGTRYIVTRDREVALAFRRLICTVCAGERACAPCGMTIRDVDIDADAAMPSRCERVRTASLADEEAMVQFARHAREIYATRTALAEVTRRFGASVAVHPLPSDIASETLEQILFHYLFTPVPNGGAPGAITASGNATPW